ncbi:MAG: SapC family protein [Phycisphaerae bacterium]
MTNGAGTVLFYQKPVLLDRVAHRHARVNMRNANFGFTKGTNSVPVAALEFVRAATEYPIVFAGPAPERLMPVVVLGLRNEENLFVDADGKWTGVYIPAFIRRYPFVLAERNNGQDLSVCVDTAFSGWTDPRAAGAATNGSPVPEATEPGEALFDDQGVETPFLKNVLDFLGQYQANIRQTQAFVKKLHDLNLLVGREIHARDTTRQPLALRGFFAIDEAKLNALNDTQIIELYRQGFLGLIHAHLISLGNIARLELRLRSGDAR